MIRRENEIYVDRFNDGSTVVTHRITGKVSLQILEVVSTGVEAIWRIVF